jgi:hypothetical protein
MFQHVPGVGKPRANLAQLLKKVPLGGEGVLMGAPGALVLTQYHDAGSWLQLDGVILGFMFRNAC